MKEDQSVQGSVERLWEHGLHEDSVFNERQNYFLVAESMLLVAYATLVSTAEPRMLVARVIASFGVLLTAVWIYVNVRQLYVVRHLRARCIEVIPDYRETYQTRRKWPISSIWLLSYFVPTIIGIMWAIFIFAL